ncbi:MAG: hypothetical protein WCD89_09415 [Anaerocolumna sp.]
MRLLRSVLMKQFAPAIVGADGQWQVVLETGDAGGPYDMVIEISEAAEKLIVRDILLGHD